MQSVQALLRRWQISAQQQQTISALAKAWVVQIRQAHQGDHPLDALFRQYQLNSDEGLALMCLAEALLRVPDRPTQMELIADKFVQAVSGETLPSGDGWPDKSAQRAWPVVWTVCITNQCYPIVGLLPAV